MEEVSKWMVDSRGESEPITSETLGPGCDGRKHLTGRKGGRGAPVLQVLEVI